MAVPIENALPEEAIRNVNHAIDELKALKPVNYQFPAGSILLVYVWDQGSDYIFYNNIDEMPNNPPALKDLIIPVIHGVVVANRQVVIYYNLINNEFIIYEGLI